MKSGVNPSRISKTVWCRCPVPAAVCGTTVQIRLDVSDEDEHTITWWGSCHACGGEVQLTLKKKEG